MTSSNQSNYSNQQNLAGKPSKMKILNRLRSQIEGSSELLTNSDLLTGKDTSRPRLTVPHTIRQQDTISQFIEKAEAAAAEVIVLSSRKGLTKQISNITAEANAPVSIGSNEKLIALFNKLGISTTHQYREKNQPIGFSIASVGISETGTLLLLPSPENPTEINFLVEHHCVILKASNIVPYFEDAWGRLRKLGKLTDGVPPVVNWVTGPSRTADIEQTIQMGAHGPRRVTILLEEYA